mmetsp:Transcript_111363/g.321957  ORF Transcript_111363/g.321957 Transcript_111363/m.321957 type:complete len:290 (-) Transcript_111363:1631-2500(-)
MRLIRPCALATLSSLESPSSTRGEGVPVSCFSVAFSSVVASFSSHDSPRASFMSSFQPPYLLPRFSPSSFRAFICPSKTKAPTPLTVFSLDETLPHRSFLVEIKVLICSESSAILAIPVTFSSSLATFRAFSSSAVSLFNSSSAAFFLSAASPTSSSSHSFNRAVASLISLEAFEAALKSRFAAAAFLSASSCGTRAISMACSASRFVKVAVAAWKIILASEHAASHFTTSACNCAKLLSASESSASLDFVSVCNRPSFVDTIPANSLHRVNSFSIVFISASCSKSASE